MKNKNKRKYTRKELEEFYWERIKAESDRPPLTDNDKRYLNFVNDYINKALKEKAKEWDEQGIWYSKEGLERQLSSRYDVEGEWEGRFLYEKNNTDENSTND